MSELPKLLIGAGVVLIVVEKENFRFYFPIVTCIVISIVLSLLFGLFRFFR